MKRIFIFSTLLLLTIPLFAQRGGGRNWQGNSGYGRIYNTQTVETVSGEVKKVDFFTPTKGWSRGVHLMLQTSKEEISIHMGPEWYLNEKSISFKEGDKIEVKGSRVTFESKPAIIASEFKRDTTNTQLRDVAGYPVWARSGGGRRR